MPARSHDRGVMEQRSKRVTERICITTQNRKARTACGCPSVRECRLRASDRFKPQLREKPSGWVLRVYGSVGRSRSSKAPETVRLDDEREPWVELLDHR